jgi:hypothetical protein
MLHIKYILIFQFRIDSNSFWKFLTTFFQKMSSLPWNYPHVGLETYFRGLAWSKNMGLETNCHTCIFIIQHIPSSQKFFWIYIFTKIFTHIFFMFDSYNTTTHYCNFLQKILSPKSRFAERKKHSLPLASGIFRRKSRTYVTLLFFPFFLINIYFQKAFSQSDFQKGPELNKQIYKEDMHILHNYEKY